MIEYLKKFIGDIIIPGCVAQLSTLNTVLRIATDVLSVQDVIKKNEHEDLYILGGVNPDKKTRAGDDDIISKNYFFLDFDIRNDYKARNNNVDLPDEEIKKIGDYLADKLNTHDLLKHWRYMIYTGNGIHIYYFGDVCKIENKRWWSLGVDQMMQVAERLTGIKPDTGCKNVARIARLPSSYNNKHGKHKLVEIMHARDITFPIDTIQKMGKEQDQKNPQKEPEEAKYDPDKTIDVINAIPIAELVCDLTGWSLDRDGRHFVEAGASKQKACFVADKGNFLVHGGTDHLPGDKDGYSPFEFVREQLRLSAADTFSWFKKKYPQVKAASTRETAKRKKEAFPFIGLEQMADASMRYLDTLDPKSIFSFGYQPLDDHLGGIYRSEVVLIGGESGTGKTSFLTKVLKHNAKDTKVLFFSLEDTLNDYTLKQVWYELGKIRRNKGYKNYPWREFRNNMIDDPNYLEDRLKAEDNVKEDKNLFFYDRTHPDAPKKMDIDTLEDLADKAASKGYHLIGVDHLHFFNLQEVGQTKADRLEQVMQRIKGIAERNDVAVILLAHYRKLFGDKPSLDSFKDSSAIVQTANVVINMWRDRSDDLGTDINETHFMMPKVRSPVGEKTIVMQFNPQTFEYEYKETKKGTNQQLSMRAQISLMKGKPDDLGKKTGVKKGENLPF